MSARLVSIEKVRLDGGTQMRGGMNEDQVRTYADDLTVLPPVDVFQDGSGELWLADGFHRLAAYSLAGRKKIPANLHKGSQRDAVLFAVKSNATHGLHRTNADKRRAVETLLRDPEWSQWSDREIARRAKVGHAFVSKMRKELSTVDSSKPRKGMDGKARKPPKKPPTNKPKEQPQLPAVADEPNGVDVEDGDGDEWRTPEMIARGLAGDTYEVAGRAMRAAVEQWPAGVWLDPLLGVFEQLVGEIKQMMEERGDG